MVRLHEWEGMWRVCVWRCSRGTVAVLWKGMGLDEGGGFCVIGIDCVKMVVVVDILIGCF